MISLLKKNLLFAISDSIANQQLIRLWCKKENTSICILFTRICITRDPHPTEFQWTNAASSVSSDNGLVSVKILCSDSSFCLQGQMQKTRGTWRAEGKCHRVGLNMEMSSGSPGDEHAAGETLASTTQNTGLFCFPPRWCLGEGKKKKILAPLKNASVLDTFCERGPYSPPQLKSMGRGATF